MLKYLLVMVSVLFALPYSAQAHIDFKKQLIAETLPQAKAEQKLTFAYFSSSECPGCKIMDKNVFSDKKLSATINDQFIPIIPTGEAGGTQMEHYRNGIKILPTIIIFDENGNKLLKVEGKRNLEEMEEIVKQILASNCTKENENLNVASGTRKGSVCCEGLTRKTNDDDSICVTRECIETTEKPIKLKGDPRQMSCCDDSLDKKIFYNSKNIMVQCVDQVGLKEINQGSRSNSKPDFTPFSKPKKKGSVPTTVSPL